MSKDYTPEERRQRMSMLMESSEEVITAYAELLIEELHDALEKAPDFPTIRFIQGQIAGVRDFSSFNKG